jgi:hypothetical protein
MARVRQLIITVEDRPGTVAAAIKSLAAAKINILSILGWNPSGVVQLITDNPRAAKKALEAAHVSCTEAAADVVEISNKPGALLELLEKLATSTDLSVEAQCNLATANAGFGSWSCENAAPRYQASALGIFPCEQTPWCLGATVRHLGRAVGQRVTPKARYAPIAAMSGLTPMMLIIRVRL